MHVDAVCTNNISSSWLLKKYMHDSERACNDPSFYPHAMLDSSASDSLTTVTTAESSPTRIWQIRNGRFYSNGRKGNLSVWALLIKHHVINRDAESGSESRYKKKSDLPARPNRLGIFALNRKDCPSVRGGGGLGLCLLRVNLYYRQIMILPRKTQTYSKYLGSEQPSGTPGPGDLYRLPPPLSLSLSTAPVTKAGGSFETKRQR
jgi:hypothetical protein